VPNWAGWLSVLGLGIYDALFAQKSRDQYARILPIALQRLWCNQMLEVVTRYNKMSMVYDAVLAVWNKSCLSFFLPKSVKRKGAQHFYQHQQAFSSLLVQTTGTTSFRVQYHEIGMSFIGQSYCCQHHQSSVDHQEHKLKTILRCYIDHT
jgi:hypothetical protein